MPIHPELKKGSLTPKEKAIELFEKSEGYFKPTSKPEPNYMAPLNISNRSVMITSIEIIVRNKELTKEDKDWWQEILIELKKLT